MLTLSMLRCPEAVPPETRQVTGGEFSIGRGPDNAWVLPDPDRFMSKRHCVLAFRSGAWHVADTSSNGTFVNTEPEPLGQGATRPLRDGDRLRFGAYEIEVRIADADARADPFGQPAPRAEPGYRDDPFSLDPFAAPSAPAAPFGGEPFGRAAFGDELHGPSPIALPADFDPLASDHDHGAFSRPTQEDHSPSVNDAFRPAPVVSSLPDDWDIEAMLAPAAPAPPAAPASPPAPAPVPIPMQAAAPLPAPVARPVAPPEFVAEPAPAPAPPAPAPPAPAPPAPAPPASAPLASAPPASMATPVAPSGDLMAAFLRGAGMAGVTPADPAATMAALGAAFRELVSGLRRALIARAAVKGEFRIEQTIISARGNNPLKFSADDDDALAALLGAGRRTEMPAPAAIADALRDIRLHELASVAAMQAAVRALVARLDPAALRAAAEQGGIALPGARKARAWDAYEALHTTVSQSLSDDFDSVFGKSFARAYETALAEIAGKETR